MNSLNVLALPLVIVGLLGGCAANSPTTVAGAYAGQQARSIKALSDDEITSLLEGRGMGYARAAELNGYPGPMHVLEYAQALALSAGQEAAIRNLLVTHKAQVRSLGKELVESERTLDALFATRAIDTVVLERQLSVIATHQASVRASHLNTHLAQTALLSPMQIEKYALLRGYGSDGRHGAHTQH